MGQRSHQCQVEYLKSGGIVRWNAAVALRNVEDKMADGQLAQATNGQDQKSLVRKY